MVLHHVIRPEVPDEVLFEKITPRPLAIFVKNLEVVLIQFSEVLPEKNTVVFNNFAGMRESLRVH